MNDEDNLEKSPNFEQDSQTEVSRSVGDPDAGLSAEERAKIVCLPWCFVSDCTQQHFLLRERLKEINLANADVRNPLTGAQITLEARFEIDAMGKSPLTHTGPILRSTPAHCLHGAF